MPGTVAMIAIAVIATLVGCSWSLKSDNVKMKFSEKRAAPGPWHREVLATTFWVGEPGNQQSAWDPKWQENFGGLDDPRKRNGWLPAAFTPRGNVFYCALPYNDVAGRPNSRSKLKGRWVEVRAGGRSCYCQWEDVGPWHVDDRAYVLGTARPRAEANGKAGIDLAPAARDYLRLSGRDNVDWRFVPDRNVPAGPWKRIAASAPCQQVSEVIRHGS
jgi:hypothetical protein